MSKLSTKIKGIKVLAITLLIFASIILSLIGDFEILLFGIISLIIFLGIIGVLVEKLPIIMGAVAGLIIILVLVSLLFSYSDSSIIKDNSILFDLTPKEDNYGKEKLNSLQGIGYIAFSILLLCYIELGYSLIRFSKFGKVMKSYNEKGMRFGYQKTNFYTTKLKTSINQYFLYVGIFAGINLCVLAAALNFNEVLSHITTEQLSNSIEFYAIYGTVLSIFAFFALIGLCRMLIPEKRRKPSKRKIKKISKQKENKTSSKIKSKEEKEKKKNTSEKELKKESKMESK